MSRMEPEPQTGPQFEHEPFQSARARHERDEAQRMRDMLSRGTHSVMWVDEETFEDTLIYAITLPMPETATQWKANVKDPAKLVGKQVAKGTSSTRSNEKQWLRRSVWRSRNVWPERFAELPSARLTRSASCACAECSLDGACENGDGTGGKRMKAKARLVVLGFYDPDAGVLNTKSPTMSCRSRQLLLQFSKHRGLTSS